MPKLHAESEHWSSIHKSWPVAYLKKKLLLTKSRSKKLEIKSQVIASFRESFAPDYVIASLMQVPILQVTSPTSLKRSPKETWWLVLGYHPAFEQIGLAKKLYKSLADDILQRCLTQCFSNRPSVRIGWRRDSPNLVELIRSRL